MANEKLIDANKYPCRNCGKTYCYQNCKEFIEWLENPVDAVEVVHGRWVFGTANHREYMKCSECLHSYTPDGTFCYCPNCGADMRERNANETV